MIGYSILLGQDLTSLVSVVLLLIIACGLDFIRYWVSTDADRNWYGKAHLDMSIVERDVWQ